MSAVITSTSVWKPKANPWLIAFVVSLAAFMEVLDTSIANVALPHIAGSMGASSDESTWVLTSYLVSNAIILPITGWLVSLIGRKRFFLICISLFTVSSLLCGIAPSLAVLLLSRVIQAPRRWSATDGLKQSWQIHFHQEKRGLAFSVYGVTAICAPSIGPTLGGWITDNYSWRWIFLMNLPVGILALFLVLTFVEDPPSSSGQPSRRAKSTTSASACSPSESPSFRSFWTRGRRNFTGSDPTSLLRFR